MSTRSFAFYNNYIQKKHLQSKLKKVDSQTWGDCPQETMQGVNRFSVRLAEEKFNGANLERTVNEIYI